MRKPLAALVAIMLAASPAVAQGHHGARADSSAGIGMMQGQSGMMQSGMMQMRQGMHGQHGMLDMARRPGTILQLRESLELTQSQVAQLETLRDSAQSSMRQHMMQGMQVMQTASELLDAEGPNLEAYEDRLREAANHMVLAHTAAARAAAEARELLTEKQRERLSLARQIMHEMQPGTMGGGMMNQDMMNQGGADVPGV